jgi:hypothetical protein
MGLAQTIKILNEDDFVLFKLPLKTLSVKATFNSNDLQREVVNIKQAYGRSRTMDSL